MADPEPAQPPAQIAPGEVDQSLQDLNDKLTEARAVPHFENGQPSGYVTYEGDGGPAPLKNGDVIHSVDGQAVENPQRAFELLSTQTVTSHRIEAITDGEERLAPTDESATAR